jgi:hypothetical protein
MIYFLALIPATALTIAGYFVLFLSHRSEGAFRTFGKYLGFWAFALAAGVVLGTLYAAAHGMHHCPLVGDTQSGANPQAPAVAPDPGGIGGTMNATMNAHDGWTPRGPAQKAG